MSNSTNLLLPYLAAGQAQKHVTVNESLRRLDAVVQLSVVSATTSAEPGSPTDGQVYILPAGKTGTNWGAMTNWALAYYRDGVWEEITPREGWLAFVKDTDKLCFYTGSAWSGVPLLSAVNSFTAHNTFSGGVDFEGVFAQNFNRAANDTDEKRWSWRLTSAGTLECVARTDASPDSGGTVAFGFTRTGATPDGIACGVGVAIGSPTGGNKGAGTLNAVAVYDDNVLLTCGPVELMREGRVDLEKWDALTPNRVIEAVFEDVTEEVEQDGQRVTRIVGQRELSPARVEPRRHEVMHRFAAMMDEGFDPRDPENYCARLAADSAVPGLITETEWRGMLAAGDKPDIGTAMTRTFLAMDCLAVAFAAALERIKALEAR